MSEMKVQQVPFSMKGSYMAISYLPKNFRKLDNEEGLYLRSIHGLSYVPLIGSGTPVVAKLVPISQGNSVDYRIKMTPSELLIICKEGIISVCFANTDTLLFNGEGENFGLRLECAKGSYAHEVPFHNHLYHMLNCTEMWRRFIALNQYGLLNVQTGWVASEPKGTCILTFQAEEGKFLAILEDVASDWLSKDFDYNYDSCVKSVQNEFEFFLASMPEVPSQYAEIRRMAAYVNWASMVKPAGVFKRPAMLMSKNHMCNVWSWDHCFNAMALAYNLPELAWDQFMIMFDYQDEMGAIPDSVNDVYVAKSFVKPPIHGWALSKMMENMNLSLQQIGDAYQKLALWTRWWLNYRDHDLDGICEYFHGNDSGWDNSTAFSKCPPVKLPDLAAFLILQMDVLEKLAKRLGRHVDAVDWKAKADRMLSSMVDQCFEDGRPKAILGRTHEQVENDSLILYLPIILGKRLPEHLRKTMIADLKSDRFYTKYGFATESPASTNYVSDGYWRGPIWAPSSLIIIDGLYQSGEQQFAKEAAMKFCNLVQQSGCAENFDALTGQGLRDRAYTWTSSTFLILAHEHLNPN